MNVIHYTFNLLIIFTLCKAQKSTILYSVSIKTTTNKYCNGIVVDRNILLTTASCASQAVTINVNKQIQRIRSVTKHPDFESTTDSIILSNDLAIIQLSQPLSSTYRKVEIEDFKDKIYDIDTKSCQSAYWTRHLGKRLEVIKYNTLLFPTCDETLYFLKNIIKIPLKDVCIKYLLSYAETEANLQNLVYQSLPLICKEKLIGFLSSATKNADGVGILWWTRASGYYDWIQETIEELKDPMAFRHFLSKPGLSSAPTTMMDADRRYFQTKVPYFTWPAISSTTKRTKPGKGDENYYQPDARGEEFYPMTKQYHQPVSNGPIYFPPLSVGLIPYKQITRAPEFFPPDPRNQGYQPNWYGPQKDQGYLYDTETRTEWPGGPEARGGIVSQVPIKHSTYQWPEFRGIFDIIGNIFGRRKHKTTTTTTPKIIDINLAISTTTVVFAAIAIALGTVILIIALYVYCTIISDKPKVEP